MPAGFAESAIAGPWSEPVGITIESNGRIYVWERSGVLWFKDPSDPTFSVLLDISEEVGGYHDLGFLGFALDPNFRVNGYIYLLYNVDRYHLLNFGTPGYNPTSDAYFEATIGRLTRYTCRSSDGFRSVDPASRLILIGETKQTGFPACARSHGVGSLVFGEDGTLLVSCGDGASAFAFPDSGGAQANSYAPQALTDGIIRPKEDIGSFRSQLVDCLNGKVLRIDPATGNGLPSNPYYDAANPRSARSRVWALGFRNPCRMALRPESGSHNPADGNPGVLYVGDVGWDNWESLKVVTGPKQNFGWPIYEGLSVEPTYNSVAGAVTNLDAPNPLYPAAGCKQYFSFADLLKEDTLDAAGQPPFVNPCNTSQRIPAAIPQFLHARPVLDWNHASAITRTPTYGAAGQAQTANVGAAGSPVSGPAFNGNCAIGGTWYTGTSFPAQYQNRYFFADWGQGVIKALTFDANDKPVALADFVSNAGFIVSMAQHPIDGSLYFIAFDYTAATVRQLSYTGNRTPIPVASANLYYGSTPLTVQLNGSGSSDPDGQPITYSWDFGDGSPVSALASPSHTFSAPAGVPTQFVVTLTVTDSGGLSAQATMIVAVNDTPPNVTITSPVDGALYSSNNATTVNLTATVSDAESSDAQLLYQWQVLLHHNDHNHGSPADTNHVTTTVIEPTGCDGINIYYYRIVLTVTDPTGLATTREVQLFSNCGANRPPTISDITNRVTSVSAPTPAIPFTVDDADTLVNNLTLSGGSSNSTLVPTNNIMFGGSGANRTVTVTPATGLSGSATITVTVSDGTNSTSDMFVLTVGNTPPTISDILNQSTTVGTPTALIPFTVGDAEASPGSLTLSKGSSNPTLVPTNNIVFGGAGSNRTVTITPALHQIGTATITVTVSDGLVAANDSFLVTVNKGQLTVTGITAANRVYDGTTDATLNTTGATLVGVVGGDDVTLVTAGASGTKSFTNSSVITIPDLGAGTPFPSIINVTGVGGTISNVTVRLRNLSHTYASDVDVLLVGPTGQKVMLMSDAGNGNANNVTLTLSDAAAAALPASGLVSGTFKPTNLSDASSGGDNFPVPAPAGPYATALSAFNGTGANGVWSLYVLDDGPIDLGSFAGGWSLTLTTAGATTGAVGTFADENAGNGKVVQVAGLTLSGADAANYTLTQPTTTANITVKGLTVTGITANDKVYDNTTTAILNKGSAALVGVVSGDVVTVGTGSAAGTFASETVGNGKPVVVSGLTLSGADAGNYTLTQPTTTANITQTALVVTADSKSRTYGAANPALTGTVVGVQGGDNITANYTTTANVSSPVGTYAIVPVLNDPASNLGNYSVTSNNGLLTITKAPATVTLGSLQPVYDGTGKNVTSATAPAGLTVNVTYDGNAAAPTNVGSYQVVSTIVDANYQGAVTNTMVITKGALTVTGITANKVYDGTNTATLNVGAAVLVGVKGDDVVTLSAAGASGTFDNETVGEDKPVQVAGLTIGGADAGNYALTQPTTLANITKAGLTVTADNKSRAYGGANPVFTGTLNGVQGGDNITTIYTTVAMPVTPVGDYAIVPVLVDPDGKLGNYSVTSNNGVLTIIKAQATVTLGSLRPVYNGTAKRVSTATGPAGLTVNVTYNGSAAAPTNAGSYLVVGTIIDSNYQGAVTNTVLITKVALTVSADNKSRVYGVANPTMTAAITGFVNGETLATSGVTGSPTLSTTATAMSPVAGGPYAITPALGTLAAGNYSFSFAAGTLMVTKAGLTVKADDKSRAYGDANPTLTATITGFMNGETLATSGVTGAAALSTTATAASPMSGSPYPITAAVGTLASANYNFNFVDGTLVVTNARLVIRSLTGAGTTNTVITWSAISNVTYRVQYRLDLNSGNWLDLVPDVTATNDTASAVDNLGDAKQRFYRVLVIP